MFILIGFCFAAASGSLVVGQERKTASEDFFETKIRPVLASRCFPCHSGQKATKGLRLDSRDALLKGGQRGSAVVSGQPEESLLIGAVRRRGELKMPPDKPLPPDEVANLERWIAEGAIWPDERTTVSTADTGAHWAFQPVRDVRVPLVEPGETAGTDWSANPIDAFLLAELHKAGLVPSAAADKRTLLRRATFDLIGLPPTPDEVDAFLADDSPAAFEKVLDRLLASPLYGERWGRHWLDLVRYTDEFDEAWRYRDWVVNAFNGDLAYDQFICQQIAGDLLPAREPGGVNADGIVATTMLALGPWTGIDRKKRLTDIADDQIDIVSRSFLGLTIACARCHDHKFDPITIADYYGLAGIFLSSRVISDEGYLSHGTTRLKIPLVSAAEVERHRQHEARIREMERRVQATVDQHYAEFARSLLPQTSRYLLAAWDYEHRPVDEAKLSLDDFATREKLYAFALTQWIAYLNGENFSAYQPLDVPERDFDGEPGVLAWRVRAERPWWAVNTNSREIPIETFNLPPRTVSINPGTEGGAVAWRSPVKGTVRITGRLADADPLDGVGIAWAVDHVRNGVRHELSSGTNPNGTVRLEEGANPERLAAVDVRPRDEISLQIRLRQGDAHYDITTVDLQILALDGSATWDLTRDMLADFLQGNPHADSLGHEAVWRFDDMAGSHRLERMPAVDPLLGPLRIAFVGSGRSVDRREAEEAAMKFQQAIADSSPQSALVDDLVGPRSPFRVKARDDAKYLPAESREGLAMQSQELDALKRALPPLPSAHGVREGGLRHSLYPGIQDVPIHVRGNYDQFGEQAPRRFPAVLSLVSERPTMAGSGRLELAHWLASPDNPLTARVLVNRLWQHHFGEGIVRTASNFGLLGERPTHPELLDFLAKRFVESGWSMKRMHRLMMLSAAYQQSSRPAAGSVSAGDSANPHRLSDPENRYLALMGRRRLEAEAIRDVLLAYAGQLDLRPGGPAEGEASRRRMLYLKTTRTSRAGLGPLFDAPNPAMHVEKRSVSTVAPQALFLMNDSAVGEVASQIAKHPEIAAETDPRRRIGALYLRLFGRPATGAEMELGMRFVEQEQSGLDGETSDGAPVGSPRSAQSADPWAIYTQALLLSNEMLFVD